MNKLNNQQLNTQIKPKNESIEDVFAIQAVMAPEATWSLADPSLALHWQGIKDRVIWFYQDVDDSLSMIMKYIVNWNAEDEKAGLKVEERKPITLMLLTYGGQADVAINLIDIMKISKTPVKTVNMGVCASAGFLIWTAGTPGYRYSLKNTWALVHQGSGGTGTGTAEQVLSAANNYKRVLKTLESIVLENTKIDQKLYNRNKNKEWYIYPESYLELGCCDHIVDDITQII